MLVTCYYDRDSSRSSRCASAFASGVRACGDRALLIEGWSFVNDGDVAFGYGWRHPEVFEAFRAKGRAFVYADLGWWERKPTGNVLGGYHKVVVNDREPTAYFRRGSKSDRLARFKVEIMPWRTRGRHVLIAGMSDKSARTRGFEPYEWERAMISALGRVTERPIWYRPKPSWLAARPIDGTRFSPPTEPLEAALRDCWAVVTLHSNVAIDALAAGVPVYCERGVGSALSMPSLAEIESPPLPEGRGELLADIAYCQWSIAEMASGTCWRHLRSETPICA